MCRCAQHRNRNPHSHVPIKSSSATGPPPASRKRNQKNSSRPHSPPFHRHRPPPTMAVPPFFSFSDDDFGDFTFVSPPPQINQQQEEDDWGDFVVGSQSQIDPDNSAPDPNPNPNPNPNNGWDKLRKGAIPLSVFGFDEDETDETEASPFPNGLSPSPPSVSPAKKPVEVKDLIADLYGQAAAAVAAKPEAEEEDDDGWDFKDASSAAVDGLEEDAISQILEWEKKNSGDNGIQVNGNRLETVQEPKGQLTFSNGGPQLGDMYAENDRFTNGLAFDSDVSHRHCVSDISQQTNQIKSANALHPSTENGVKSVGVQLWDFGDAFFSNADLIGSLGEQNTANADADMIMPAPKVQDTATWENNQDSYHASTDNNGNENRTGPIETTSRPFQKPNSAELKIKDSMFHSVVALDDVMSSLYGENDQSHSVLPTQFLTPDGPNIAEISPDSVSLNGDGFFDDNEWEFQKAPDTIISGQNSACRTDESLSYGSPQNLSLDLYARLKEESLFLMVHHLGDLKKAHEVASLSGEQAKVLKIDEDIQVLRKKLQEAMVSESMYTGKHPSKDACVSKLVDFINDFQDFEQEYRLSERILLAEKDLSAAVELYEHVTSVLHILGLASKEEQQTYITAWSKMVVACAEELQHGAMIWTESLSANVSRQILSRGNRYFLALGEIYRVSEILRASSKVYKPWLLSNQEDNSRELLTGLDKCAEAWKTMDLKANTQFELKAIHHFDDQSFYNHAFGSDMICRLSLLPMGMQQGNTLVKWDGDHYCLTLANLWANRVSCCPPQLPCILAS